MSSDEQSSKKSNRGFFITRCKVGHGVQIRLPDGQIIYMNVLKSNEKQAEIAVKVPKNVQIKRIT